MNSYETVLAYVELLLSQVLGLQAGITMPDKSIYFFYCFFQMGKIELSPNSYKFSHTRL